MRLFYRLKRLVEWVPVIWATEDWDSAYVRDILKYSLYRLRKSIEPPLGHSLNWQKDTKRIRTCELLIERMNDLNNYVDWDAHYAKWPFRKMMIDGEGRRITEPMSEAEGKEFRKLADHEEYLRKQDLQYLGFILGKYMRDWWD